MKADALRNIVKWATRSRRPRAGDPAADRAAGESLRRKTNGEPTALRFRSVAPLNSRTLVLPAANIGIIWSPKSASTKVILWYFKLTGLLDAAMFYHPWPHNYRVDVLYSSHEYINWMRNSDWKTFTWYQFARDPVKRLLSSYRHNLGYRYAEGRISKATGKNVSSAKGYSLDDFLRYLDTQNLDGACDPHVKIQRNPIADVVPINTINIDEADMLEQMNAIERKHGLPITDFRAVSAFQSNEKQRAKISAQEQFSANRVLSTKDARGAWPLEASILDMATTQRIKQLYARDMKFLYNEDHAVPSPRKAKQSLAARLRHRVAQLG